MNQITVHKGRRNVLQVSIGMDISQDQFVSEIRAEKHSESDLLATWTVAFATDGTDGELLLTLSSTDSKILKSTGYMDLKRITGSEPVPVFDDPLEVLFKDTITA